MSQMNWEQRVVIAAKTMQTLIRIEHEENAANAACGRKTETMNFKTMAENAVGYTDALNKALDRE